MENLMEKLNFSFIKKVQNDANIDKNSHEKLKELTKLLEEIVAGKKTSIRQDHFIYRTARHLRNVVRGQAAKTKHIGAREYARIQREKQQLARKEKEAKEKAGKR